MSYINLQFSPELEFFLARSQRRRALVYPIVDFPSIRHPIESLGVPHTEVGLILVNGRSVRFSERMHSGDTVKVFGHSDAPLIPQAALLRPRLAPPVHFVLDIHLGRLARRLRLLGFDTLYNNGYEDAELAAISASQQRALLTRDRGLLKHKIVDHGYCLRTTNADQQILDVVRRFDLVDQFVPYTRCLTCNGELVPVSKADVLHLLEPKTKVYYEEFSRCAKCGRIFWKGSHTERMDALIQRCTRSVDN